MMEENNDIFLAGGDALVHLAVPMHKKYSTNFFWAIHLVRTMLVPIFQPPASLYAFSATVSAVGLFQKILLNTIAHMY